MFKDECIFCSISKKETPAKIVYEDDLVLAFLDVDPLTEGHTLIIPKVHYDNLLDIDLNLLKYIVEISQKLARHYDEVLKPHGFNIMQNTKDAGGHVNHYHMHLIPRWPSKDRVEIMKSSPSPENDYFSMLDETLNKIKLDK